MAPMSSLARRLRKTRAMNDRPYKKMRKNILSSMILVPFVPFILILCIGYYYFTNSIQNSTISNMRRIIEDHRHMIESFLMERRGDLEFILRSYSFQDLRQPSVLSKVLTDLQMKSNAFLDLGVFDEDGLHVAYQGPYRLEGKVYKDAEWFKEVMKQGVYTSDVFLGYRRIPHFVIAVKKKEGISKWVLRSTIDTHIFNDLVKKVLIGKTGEAYLLNEKGIFQTERRSGGNLLDRDPESLKYPKDHIGIKTFIETDMRKDAYLYATTWLQNKNWLLVVRQEKADAFRALRSATYLIMLIMLIGGGGILAVALYLTNRIIGRLQRADMEKDQLGEQLIRASRLAELGEMAAGFAHEINNPLQIIKSEYALIDTILSDMAAEGELQASENRKELEESIKQIIIQVDRCSEITQAILKFGRKSERISKDIQLQEFVPEVIKMVEKKSSVHGITLRQEISPDVPRIFGDPSQLQQVLLNLLNNAIDAVIAKHGASGGSISLGALKGDDGRVRIEVQDNGSGISPENLKRIFTPFFTTKPVGKGTGLGLSVCYGIIDSMGGVMEVESKKGSGTIFKIHLPAAG